MVGEMPEIQHYTTAGAFYTPNNLYTDTCGLSKKLAQGANILGDAYTLKLPVSAREEKIFIEEIVNMPKRRLAKVFIVDTDENIPLDNAILYESEEKLTDATDQELFFEIDIQSLLKDHNEIRAKVKDKEASKEEGETVYLEPIRIRDLKMIVTTSLEF